MTRSDSTEEGHDATSNDLTAFAFHNGIATNFSLDVPSESDKQLLLSPLLLAY